MDPNGGKNNLSNKLSKEEAIARLEKEKAALSGGQAASPAAPAAPTTSGGRPMPAKQWRYDKAYMRMALEWAKLSHCNRAKVGCLIVKGKMIINDIFDKEIK